MNLGHAKDVREVLPETDAKAAAAASRKASAIDFNSAIETVSAAEDADLPLGFGRD